MNLDSQNMPGRIKLLGHSAVVPSEKISSSKIEELLAPLYQRLKLPDGRLEELSGVAERRLWPMELQVSEMGVRAARNLIDQMGISPCEIDGLIFCSVCRDQIEPATAMRIHHDLKLSSQAFAYDLSNACVGLLSALESVWDRLQARQERILLVTSENSSPLLFPLIEKLNSEKLNRRQLKEHFASFTLGSGATAWLVSGKSADQGADFEGTTTQVRSEAYTLCQGQGDHRGMTMRTDSSRLMKHGLELAKQTFELFLKTFFENDVANIQKVVTHQVGEAHRKSLFKVLGLQLGQELSIFNQFGNTGSSAIPMALNWADQFANWHSGQQVALLGIGSGLSCTMAKLKWQEIPQCWTEH